MSGVKGLGKIDGIDGIVVWVRALCSECGKIEWDWSEKNLRLTNCELRLKQPSEQPVGELVNW